MSFRFYKGFRTQCSCNSIFFNGESKTKNAAVNKAQRREIYRTEWKDAFNWNLMESGIFPCGNRLYAVMEVQTNGEN